MTGLRALTARNMVSNRAFISGMLKGESLIRFTVWTGHLGWQVRIQKSLRERSIFSSETLFLRQPQVERKNSRRATQAESDLSSAINTMQTSKSNRSKAAILPSLLPFSLYMFA
jgi:hypothetical protein